MSVFKQISTFLSKEKRANWCLFFIFSGILFLKNVLFHYFTFHSILISSLWKHPLEFLFFYIPKIGITVFIASFVFLCKRQWWTVIISILIDIWMISNLLYYGANGLFLDLNSILLANNLTGFEEAIGTFFSYSYLLIPVLTILFIPFVWFLQGKAKRSYKLFLTAIFIGGIFHILSCIKSWKYEYYDYREAYKFIASNAKEDAMASTYGMIIFKPFYHTQKNADVNHPHYNSFNQWSKGYIKNENIIQYIPAMCIYCYLNNKTSQSIIMDNDSTITENLSPFLNNHQLALRNTPSHNIILFIVESFESWITNTTHINNIPVMPNLQRFITENPILYCDSISSQALNGVSGDGQLILNTGLLPIQRGAVTSLYNQHTFPSWAHYYPNSMTIAPCNTWNQDTMSVRYGYQQTVIASSKNELEWERTIFNEFYNQLDTITKHEQPFAIQVLTVASHSPFLRHTSTETFSDDMPLHMKNYLCSLNYTDSCMQCFFEEFKRNTILQNSVIVITGDHTVFKENMLHTMLPYAQKYNLPITTNESYCPLIIYSPKIKENIRIDEVCYQMDIYPTILHLIGADNYYWKGLGVNLLDSTARHNRPITEEEAYQLSDKMIRTDYFRNIIDSISTE